MLKQTEWQFYFLFVPNPSINCFTTWPPEPHLYGLAAQSHKLYPSSAPDDASDSSRSIFYFASIKLQYLFTKNKIRVKSQVQVRANGNGIQYSVSYLQFEPYILFISIIYLLKKRVKYILVFSLNFFISSLYLSLSPYKPST